MSHRVPLSRAAAALVPLAVLAVAAPAAAAPPTPPAPAAAVETVDLGSLGGTQTFASLINATGQVAGQSTNAAGAQRAFLWTDGVLTDLGVAPDGTFSLASGLTDSGLVLGYGDTATGSAAFVWQDGVRTELPAPGIGQVRPAGINDSGTVIGTDVTTSDLRRGFLWRSGQLTDLGSLEPALINDAGVVVGTVAEPDGSHRIVRWVDGVDTDLGTPGPATGLGAPYLVDLTERGDVAAYVPTGTGHRAYVRRAGATGWRELRGLPGATDVRVTALNEVGQAVGTSNRGPGTLPSAVSWGAGPARALPTLGGNSSEAYDLNDRGDVSGFSTTPSGDAHAAIWRDGVLLDVGPAGADSSAGALNEAGQAVGSAFTLDDRIRAFRWTVTG
ncbi:MAG: hypothetical protein AVDCRST_MAG41-1824 [uncultured Corynebacteriales bacterium]|uniref:Extracellular repeat, HAF family n=1 Tax=uncultured Mycobacteriales bacterium TaxID=581187 RepID=A0A6J4IEF4_9ACTN|nr:MAG: hypothetical protein AVDCRST_MAG41-1824 [uncultured Corynebacteriales bacterium]